MTPEATGLPAVSRKGLPVSLRKVLEHPNVLLLFRHDLLQPLVLFLKLLESLGLFDFMPP